jgi:hypothetical protein
MLTTELLWKAPIANHSPKLLALSSQLNLDLDAILQTCSVVQFELD